MSSDDGQASKTSRDGVGGGRRRSSEKPEGGLAAEASAAMAAEDDEEESWLLLVTLLISVSVFFSAAASSFALNVALPVTSNSQSWSSIVAGPEYDNVGGRAGVGGRK